MMDIYEYTENSVKEFVLGRLDLAREYPEPHIIKDMESQAYGAIQFASNYSFPTYNCDLAIWWHDIKQKFRELL